MNIFIFLVCAVNKLYVVVRFLNDFSVYVLTLLRNGEHDGDGYREEKERTEIKLSVSFRRMTLISYRFHVLMAWHISPHIEMRCQSSFSCLYLSLGFFLSYIFSHEFIFSSSADLI